MKISSRKIYLNLFAECDLFLEKLKLEKNLCFTDFSIKKNPQNKRLMLRSTLVFFANSNDCDHFCENCRSKLLCSLKLCNMDVRYFENICFHGTPSLSLKELASLLLYECLRLHG